MYPEAVQRRKILLAGGTWRPRALILAQLKEEGYDVTAAETWDEAELLLRTHAVRSDAPRVLVLTSPSQLPAATARSLGFEHVLARPYSVGDVVAAVRTLLAER
jgi:CheY-like chemotaxis protein